MNIGDIKSRLIARRHQLVQLDTEGRLVASCDTLLPLMSLAGTHVLQQFHLFEGLEETILGLQSGEPPLHLPMVDFEFEGKSYRLSLEFWAEEGIDGFLWLMSVEDTPSERLRAIQQERNETYIGLERVVEQEQTLREYTARLEQAHQALQRFAYIISHDLKAPLRAIGNIALWIGEAIESQDYSELPEHLSLLRSRVFRMESLIDGIARYHRAGGGQVELGYVDLNALLRELHTSIFEGTDCQLIIPAELPSLYCCRTAIYQVLSNLLSNIAKYGRPSGSVITIWHRDLGKRHEFAVSDNGPGIDPKHHNRIFDIFQTLQSKDENDSTGIGLSIVQRIVQDCGGTVWVESEVGQGASFKFTWPKVDPEAAQRN